MKKTRKIIKVNFEFETDCGFDENKFLDEIGEMLDERTEQDNKYSMSSKIETFWKENKN